jgi:hypothetical protein
MFRFIIFKCFEIANYIEQKIVNSYFGKIANIIIYRISLEPIKNEWFNISWLDNFSVYKDNYLWFNNDVSSYNDKSLLFVYKNKTTNTHIIKEITLPSLNLIQEILSENKANDICKKKFIFIEYHDIDSNVVLNIKLDDSYYRVGNDILSSTFIKRYLQYNYGSSIQFNINYKVNIIDSDVLFLTLDKNHYIKIEKDCYYKKKNIKLD